MLTHLLLQEHLRSWLREQGLESQIEKRLSHGGRADLHFRVAGNSQSIEVQLSALGHDAWVKRTALYQSQVRHLHWLYGPEVGGGLADEETVATGWALLIDWEHRTSPEGTADLAVDIGTMCHAWTRWSPLAECRITSDGFVTPYLGEAKIERRRQEEEQQRRRVDQVRATASQRRAMHQLQQQRALVAAGGAERAGQRRTGATAARVPASTLSMSGVLRWMPSFPEWAGSEDWSFLDDLQERRLHDAAKVMTFVVRRCYFSGPIEDLSFVDVADEGALRELLVRAGVVKILERYGVQRWERVQ